MSKDWIVAQYGMLRLDEVPDPDHHNDCRDADKHPPTCRAESRSDDGDESQRGHDEKYQEACHAASLAL
ncbi:hypothetical protein GCM10027562_15210 [Arthrobacter pigmenti]